MTRNCKLTHFFISQVVLFHDFNKTIMRFDHLSSPLPNFAIFFYTLNDVWGTKIYVLYSKLKVTF
jgi:hypothetical protein